MPSLGFPADASPVSMPASLTAGANLRAAYQKGLLAWLKTPEEKAGQAGLEGMLLALNAQCAALPPGNAAIFVAASVLLVAIRNRQLAPLPEYRRLAAKVEQAFKKDAPDAALLAALEAPLRQMVATPAVQSDNAAHPRDPLDAALEATHAILPLVAHPHEPRFSTTQRALWDNAVEAMSLAWAGCRIAPDKADWSPLRRALFNLLDGALALAHPAPLQLAEALAAATDTLETTPPTARLLTTLDAVLELLQEKDFLEHDALATRVEQLVTRLERRDEGPRSRPLDTLFVREAEEEIQQMRHAQSAVPPDRAALAQAARHLRQLAEPLDLAPLAWATYRFAQIVSTLDPLWLDRTPGYDILQGWIDCVERWIRAIDAGHASASSTPPVELAHWQVRLQAGDKSPENEATPQNTETGVLPLISED
ncbi:MAG: hypothetical protein LBF51_03060 [Zoogloeaceae bacterium]|jgi:hypothetical protein|nr:hypothetical protein [Zoogloeaceae bacterium]